MEPGFYDKITVDASGAYVTGYNKGKENATITFESSSIIVDPGDGGKFPDGSASPKTYSSNNMSNFSLSVSPVSAIKSLSGWKVDSSNGSIKFTAQWKTINTTYNYSVGSSLFTAPVTGVYHLEAYGAEGGNAGYAGAFESHASNVNAGGGYGGRTSADIHLKAGQLVYVYVGTAGSPRGAGGGATAFRVDTNTVAGSVCIAGGGGAAHKYAYYDYGNRNYMSGNESGLTSSVQSIAGLSDGGGGGYYAGRSYNVSTNISTPNGTKSQGQSTGGSGFVGNGAYNGQINYGGWSGNGKAVITLKTVD